MLHRQLTEKRYTPLTKEEEQELGRALVACTNLKQRQKIIETLILRHLRLVYSIAKQYKKLPIDDAFNVGVLALTEAMNRWQPSSTSMNAYQWAKRYVTTALNKATDNARSIRLPEQVAYKAALNTRAVAMHAHNLCRPLTTKEIKDITTGPCLQDLPTCATSLNAPGLLDDGSDIGASVPDTFDLEATVEARESLKMLAISLNALTDIERTVIQARFGLGETERQTLAQLGKQLKISGEAVRKVEASALAKLKHPANTHTQEKT